MKKHFIDEDEVFAINDNLDARVELMGWEKIPIVYVDNFYKNPKLVRDLALRTPPTKNPRICGGLPGQRLELNVHIDHFIEVMEDIATNVYGLKMGEVNAFRQSCKDNPFCVNVIKDCDKIPHIDTPIDEHRGFASLIYLNIPKECRGGTGFYTYRGMQVDPTQDGIFMPDESVTDSVGPWELIHLAEMKFNRMIFYPDQVLHGAYMKPDWYNEDCYRLTQMYFMPLCGYIK
jgi:hypothetical protein